jgi:regulator of sigma E protease
VGDTITHVNGVRVHTGNEAVYEIMNRGYEPVDLTVRRGGERVELTGVIFPGMESEGIAFGSPDFRVFEEPKNFGTVMKHTFFRSVSTVKMIIDQLVDMVRGRFGMNAVSGPIGVTEEMGNAAKSGFSNFLYLVIVITINLGVFNLLPIPALDGGRLLFLLIEAVIGRPVNKNVEGYIHFAGFVILFGLIIVVSCKDIAGLFAR